MHTEHSYDGFVIIKATVDRKGQSGSRSCCGRGVGMHVGTAGQAPVQPAKGSRKVQGRSWWLN